MASKKLLKTNIKDNKNFEVIDKNINDFAIIEEDNNIFLNDNQIINFIDDNTYLIYFDTDINIYSEDTILLINIINCCLEDGNKILLITDQKNIKKSIIYDFENNLPSAFLYL
jgi:hypothetical protein